MFKVHGLTLIFCFLAISEIFQDPPRFPAAGGLQRKKESQKLIGMDTAVLASEEVAFYKLV